MTVPRSHTLIIGVGNPFRSDDAAGLEVARRLREKNICGTTILEHGGEGADLLEVWKGAQEVIVIDAVQSGAAPGTVHRIDAVAEKLPGWVPRGSTHALGVAEAVELARALGELPPRMILYGIEGRNFAAGTELSPEVARASEELARLLEEKLKLHGLAANRSGYSS